MGEDPVYAWRGFSEGALNNHHGFFKLPKLKEIMHLKCLLQLYSVVKLLLLFLFLICDDTDYTPWVRFPNNVSFFERAKKANCVN